MEDHLTFVERCVQVSQLQSSIIIGKMSEDHEQVTRNV